MFASDPVHVHRSLSQVQVEAIFSVLAAWAGLAPAGVETLDQIADRAVHVDLAELEFGARTAA
jgi:hypothetical protein